jgi:hypothetical protein
MIHKAPDTYLNSKSTESRYLQDYFLIHHAHMRWYFLKGCTWHGAILEAPNHCTLIRALAVPLNAHRMRSLLAAFSGPTECSKALMTWPYMPGSNIKFSLICVSTAFCQATWNSQVDTDGGVQRKNIPVMHESHTKCAHTNLPNDMYMSCMLNRTRSQRIVTTVCKDVSGMPGSHVWSVLHALGCVCPSIQRVLHDPLHNCIASPLCSKSHLTPKS